MGCEKCQQSCKLKGLLEARKEAILDIQHLERYQDHRSRSDSAKRSRQQHKAARNAAILEWKRRNDDIQIGQME